MVRAKGAEAHVRLVSVHICTPRGAEAWRSLGGVTGGQGKVTTAGCWRRLVPDPV